MNGNDPLVFDVEIDKARFDVIEPAMCASLLHQNRAFRDRVTPQVWRERLRKIGIVVGAIGVVLTVLMLLLGPNHMRGKGLAFLAIFTPALALFWNGRRIEAFFDALPPKTIARQVRRIVGRLRKKCPYTITYSFDELGYHVEADALAISKRVAFKDFRFALLTTHFVHLYRGPKALSPKAVVYFADEAHRSAIHERLFAAGVTVVPID